MKGEKRRPGRVPPRHRPERQNSEINNREANQSLAVELTDAEQTFAKKVMAQLPGLPQPLIWVVLTPPIKDDTQRLASAYGEPIAIVNMEGELLAYRMPQ
jgi:hypothetical protein